MAEVLPSDELVEEPSDYGSLAPGTRLGRYELLVPVARGGMARVWAARQTGQRGFQKLVALKTILPHLAREKQFERMFLDEARIASGVHHPNVCEIYELGEESHTLYLAMEWVSGDSLARLLRATGNAEALDARVVARIVADACAGAHAAHELTDDDGKQLGVVHRDLSPHNILLTGDGVAKVADFGVAKALGQLHDATSAGQLKGKLAYMAPEQITGGAMDRRSDVFSLGCVLYEATTGQRPFRGEGDHQVMHAVLKGEYLAPSSIVRGYPQELERIVQRALSPQAILRYPTAERMRFALEEFLARGSLVTQSNVAQLLRQRLGPMLDKRRDRIKQASSVGDRERGWSEPPPGMAPDPAHRSGVKQAQPRPLYTTMAFDGGSLPGAAPPAAMPALDAPTVRETARPPGGLGAAPAGPAIPGAPGVPTGMGMPGGMPTGPADWSRPGPGMVPHTGRPQTIPPTSGGMHPNASGAYAAPSYAMTPPHQTAPQPGYGMHPGMQGVHGMSGMHGMPGVPPSVAGPGPSGTFPHGGPPGVATDERPSHAPATNGQYAFAIVAGLLVAALIGGGGFYAWQRNRHADATTNAPPRPADSGTTTGTAPVAPPPVMTGTGAAEAKGDLVFQTTPENATLVVDGRELPPGTHHIARPPPGTTVTLVVRAPGKKDATRLVDYFTTSPTSIALEDAASPTIEVADDDANKPAPTEASAKPRPATPPTTAPTTATGNGAGPATSPPTPTTATPAPNGGGSSGAGGGARPKPPKTDPGLPANPY